MKIKKVVEGILEYSDMTLNRGSNGLIEYISNGKFHRDDGPAIIWIDGTVFYYVNGKRHREDGPAVIFSNGREEYWVNGERQ